MNEFNGHPRFTDRDFLGSPPAPKSTSLPVGNDEAEITKRKLLETSKALIGVMQEASDRYPKLKIIFGLLAGTRDDIELLTPELLDDPVVIELLGAIERGLQESRFSSVKSVHIQELATLLNELTDPSA